MKDSKNNTTKIEVNQVQIKFSGKKITAYGGFSILALLLERLHFKEFIESIIPFKEKSGNSAGIYSKIISYFSIILAGGSRYKHLFYLGESEEIFKKFFNIKKFIKADTSLTRFFNKFKSWRWNEELADKLWAYVFSFIPWKKLNDKGGDFINFDSTVLTRYGKQEGAKKGYNPKKKGRPSHHPLIAFLNRCKFIVNLWNRAGNAVSSENIVSFARQTFERMNGKLSIRGVMADTSFYVIDFIKYLESIEGLVYIIAVKLYEIIQFQLHSAELKWIEVAISIEISEFWFCHKNPKWVKPRRYFVIRRKIDKVEDTQGKQLTIFPELELSNQYKYSVYITNSNDDILNLWRKYRLRIEDENRIKELKEDFALNGFSHKGFYATESSMLIRALLFNIFNLFRTEMLPNSEKTSRMKTIRFKYFVIAGILGRCGNKMILRLGVSSKKLKAKLIYLFSIVRQWIPPFQIEMQCI